jgi:hypothetical protein
MRSFLGPLFAAAIALCLPQFAADASAQCTVGCVSSSSCAGSGKGSCRSVCDGAGTCACGDTSCGTQLRPTTLGSRDNVPLIWAADGEGGDLRASLLVDCHGNVLDVQISTSGGNAVFGDLAVIRIERPRLDGAARFAVRE